MINDPLSLDKAIEILNELATLDPEAALCLVETRYPCNALVADSENFQVHSYPERKTVIGFLGVVNGLFGTFEQGKRKGWGPICAQINADGTVRFVKTPNEEEENGKTPEAT